MERSRLPELNRPAEGGEMGTDTLPARLTRVIESVAYDLAHGRNVFVSGGAGTGKSVLIRNVAHVLRRVTGTPAICCAPTGLAARNVGGATVHNQFGLTVRPLYLDDTIDDLMRSNRVMQRLDHLRSKTSCIIIDEVSMTRRDLFDTVAYLIARVNGKSRPTGRLSIPLLVVGDFYQLPPVVPGSALRSLQEHYHTNFEEMLACSSPAWHQFDFRTYELTEPLRQSVRDDADYVWSLNGIRVSGSRAADELMWLSEHTRKAPDEHATHIYPRRAQVREENLRRFGAELAKHKQTCAYRIEDNVISVNRALDDEHELRQWLDGVCHREDDGSNLIAEHALVLIGANEASGAFVNGDRGIVVNLDHERADAGHTPRWVDVELIDNDFRCTGKVVHVTEVERERRVSWTSEDIAAHLRRIGMGVRTGVDGIPIVTGRVPSGLDGFYNGDAYLDVLLHDTARPRHDLVTTMVSTLPVQLAYALTIHKAQGQTIKGLDAATRDLWSPGQFYVAVSRCTTASELHLIGGIDPASVRVSPEAHAYLDHVTWIADDDLETFPSEDICEEDA